MLGYPAAEDAGLIHSRERLQDAIDRLRLTDCRIEIDESFRSDEQLDPAHEVVIRLDGVRDADELAGQLDWIVRHLTKR